MSTQRIPFIHMCRSPLWLMALTLAFAGSLTACAAANPNNSDSKLYGSHHNSKGENTFNMSARSKEVWVINTLTLNPGEKPEVVAGLQLELVDKLKKNWPGFISQETLISKDGRTVTTVEAYENFEALKAIAEDSRLVEYRKRIQQHATMSPVVYGLGGSTRGK